MDHEQIKNEVNKRIKADINLTTNKKYIYRNENTSNDLKQNAIRSKMNSHEMNI